MPSPPDTLLFLRTDSEQRVLCGFNLSEHTQVFEVDGGRGFGIDLSVGRLPDISTDGQISIGSGGGFVAAARLKSCAVDAD